MPASCAIMAASERAARRQSARAARTAAMSANVAAATLSGHHEIDRFRPLAFFVRLDVEADALSFGQRLQARALDRGNVHEHVAAAVIRLDEAVAAFAIEELDRAGHRHWELLSPNSLRGPARRPLGWTFTNGERRRPRAASVTSAGPPTGGGTSKPTRKN